MQIKEKVRKIVVNLLQGSENLNDDEFLKTVGLNSINFIQMIVALEDEFDMEFDEEEIDDYEKISINSLCVYIESKL